VLTRTLTYKRASATLVSKNVRGLFPWQRKDVYKLKCPAGYWWSYGGLIYYQEWQECVPAGEKPKFDCIRNKGKLGDFAPGGWIINKNEA